MKTKMKRGRPAKNSRVDALRDALQANRDEVRDGESSITPADFEQPRLPVIEQRQDIPEYSFSPGEAERMRMLKQIQSSNIIKVPENAKAVKVWTSQNTMEDEMNRITNDLKAKISEQNKSAFPNVTLEHYKTLKKNLRFWEMLSKHDVLGGLNGKELDELADVMVKAFEPAYNFDQWCPNCIGEFLKDLYNHFERWEKQQQETVKDYETIIKKDKF